MINFHDLQYYCNVEIGGQTLRGIFDTGSFDLVVFSKSCRTCGKAPAYSERFSHTFAKGAHTQIHAYGSGSCQTREAQEEVVLGCQKVAGMDMWLAMECQMPLLEEASFNAIVGIGPPGEAEHTAREAVAKARAKEQELRSLGMSVPWTMQQATRRAEELLQTAQQKVTFLQRIGVERFSTCYGRARGSSAWMIWNDEDRMGHPGVKTVPVVGNVTWAVKLENLVFSSPTAETKVGCDPSCGAIVDTGTSLLGVPSNVYNMIADTINQNGWTADCSDLSRFPDLVMHIGGHRFRLPPSSYIASAVGSLNSHAAGFVRLDRIGNRGSPCQLMLMDLGQQKTQYGPMFVLGIPFFREYYTTFELGGTPAHKSRSLLFSPAGEGCVPNIGEGLKAYATHLNFDDIMLRQLDVSKLRVPQWLLNRTTDLI